MFQSLLRVSLASFCFLMAGCGSSGIVAVSGTLTYKGKPVTNAFVNFKGAKTGKHRVFVAHNALADAGKPGLIPGMPAVMSGEQKELFRKYGGDNSKVMIEITKPEGNLELKWD